MRWFQHLLAIVGSIFMSANAIAEPAKVISDAHIAAQWIATALNGSGYKADFTIESLKEIDRFFDEHAENGQAKNNGLLADNLGSKLFALGAYVGESIQRQVGGQWQGDDSDREAEINISLALGNGKLFWPVQRVIKRFKNGAEDELYFYGKMLASD